MSTLTGSVSFRRLKPLFRWEVLILSITTAVSISAAVSQVRPIPPMAGRYQSLGEHPRVFTTASELAELAARITGAGSYSGQRFSQFAAQVARDLASPNDWGAAYSGCAIKTYLFAFSYEPQEPGYRTRLQADLAPGGGAPPLAGTAVVASRLALYSALAKAGVHLPSGAPNADKAAALAKRIVLAWTEHGFQQSQGHFLALPSQFCADDGKVDEATETQVGLQIARGVLYSVQAHDLLMYLGVIAPDEIARLNAFHAAMYELIRNALNHNFDHHAWACDHYNNHAANQLAGLLATARLLDDRRRFDAALSGSGAIPVKVTWVGYFDRAVYGDADAPNECYPNSGSNGPTSKPFFQTGAVTPGEIDDRYRNAVPLQGIGYPMFTLERLFDSAEIMRIAGYRPYDYRGAHGQSIEMAIRYYACYAKAAGFGKLITAQNAGSCANSPQYVGKVVNDVDRNILIGAYRFSGDPLLSALEPAARTAAALGPFSQDAILFGRWRD
jgi:hypothetical protein